MSDDKQDKSETQHSDEERKRSADLPQYLQEQRQKRRARQIGLAAEGGIAPGMHGIVHSDADAADEGLFDEEGNVVPLDDEVP